MFDQQIKIVPATEKELLEIAELEKIYGLSQWGFENFRTALNNEQGLIFVAKANDKTIGFVFARLIIPEFEIINIAVAPKARKQGIGSSLIEKVLKLTAEKGCEVCWLEVRESNRAALGFYQSLGFSIVGRRRKYYSSPEEDALLLEYKFQPNLD